MRLALTLAALVVATPSFAQVVPLHKTDLCSDGNFRYSAIKDWLKDIKNQGGGGATQFYATSEAEFVLDGQVANGKRTASNYQCIDYKVSAIAGSVPSDNACCYLVPEQ